MIMAELLCYLHSLTAVLNSCTSQDKLDGEDNDDDDGDDAGLSAPLILFDSLQTSKVGPIKIRRKFRQLNALWCF